MRVISTLVLCSLAALPGCASMKVVAPDRSQAGAMATLMVFRESAFNAGGADLYFGEGERYYLKLQNKDYGEVELPAGSHQFVVTARGSGDFVLPVTLAAGRRSCIKTYADPANWAKTLVPILMNVTAVFKAEVVECPGAQALATYTRVGSGSMPGQAQPPESSTR